MKQTDLYLIHQVFEAMGNPVPLSASDADITKHSFYYRNNPDGTIRWVWPAGSDSPVFLKFYNTSSKRAKILSFIIRLLFFFQLQKLFASGSLTLEFNKGNDEVFSRMMGNRWALFTGTAGVNRTALFYGKNIFYKVPVGEASGELIKVEYEMLNRISQWQCPAIEIPYAVYKKGILMQTDIFKEGKQLTTLGNTHWKALYQMAQCNNQKIRIREWNGWQQLNQSIDKVVERKDIRLNQSLVNRLQQLQQSIAEDEFISVASAHGDFTPWNMKVIGDRLALIDWELAEPQQPLLFDAFHFVFQQSVLVDHCPILELDIRLEAALNHLHARLLIEENAIDVKLHYRLYLLYTIAYYLDKYSLQQDWHQQIQWSLTQWNHSLSQELADMQICTCRELVIIDLFEMLSNQRYAALKWITGNPARLSDASDIDLCVQKGVEKNIFQFMHAHPMVAKVREQRKSFMTNFSILFQDHGFLSVDAIWKMKRKELVMLDAGNVLERAYTNPYGVKVPSLEDDFMYTWLFYLLNKADVPEKYQRHFSFVSIETQHKLNNSLGELTRLPFRNYSELYEYSEPLRVFMISRLKVRAENKNWELLKNKTGYYMDVVRQPFSQKGFIITFSGVDGAGKSTVIENVKWQIEKKYRRKVVVLRHRPAVLPMLSAWKEGRKAAEQKAAERLPRMGKNGSRLSSLFRFGYYYTDYLLGQFVVHFKYVQRGYVVLYDRYYFDFINDGKRSNIVLPAKFTSWWYALLLKPKFNFFLYADADTILKRKKELDAPTIKALTNDYLNLFGNMQRTYRNSKYIPIRNEQLPQTLELILHHVKSEAV